MSLLECSSCGGLLDPKRRCCPHCHCSLSGKQRIAMIAAAAFLGLAACDHQADATPPYGASPIVDLASNDQASVVPDMAEPDDGGSK